MQRWIDLLAALLVRHYPATLEELARDVPAYQSAGTRKSTLLRMFERDKDELRSFGVPLRTVMNEEGELTAYQLSTRDFYMPYLSVATARRVTGAKRVDRYGYGSLPSLTFEPDELAVVGEAAARVAMLGDPLLAAHARSAMRKLAFDLPPGSAATGEPELLPPRARADEHLFEPLGRALRELKRVSFDYRAIERDTITRRTVEPYGLFFLHGHWYLAGRDGERAEVRNFRLSRMSRLEVNATRANSRDYEVPTGFHLSEHARSRQAWELGDADAVEAIVEFQSRTGAAMAAARLGVGMSGSPSRRRFLVRRLDTFARWLLSLGEDAQPLSPETLVIEYRRQLRETLELYRGSV